MESTSVACEEQSGSSSEASRVVKENEDDEEELEMVRVNSGRGSGSEFGSGIFTRIFSPITALHLSDRTECETASFLKALGREKREQKKNVLLKFSRKKKPSRSHPGEVVNNVSREKEREREGGFLLLLGPIKAPDGVLFTRVLCISRCHVSREIISSPRYLFFFWSEQQQIFFFAEERVLVSYSVRSELWAYSVAALQGTVALTCDDWEIMCGFFSRSHSRRNKVKNALA